MEWFEKESAYAERYASGKIATNLWKFIPAKLDEAVYDAFADADGYWIYLNSEAGWRAYDHADDCGLIHEYTISDLKDAIKTIERINDGI